VTPGKSGESGYFGDSVGDAGVLKRPSAEI
jgi:hypothetical protein